MKSYVQNNKQRGETRVQSACRNILGNRNKAMCLRSTEYRGVREEEHAQSEHYELAKRTGKTLGTCNK